MSSETLAVGWPCTGYRIARDQCNRVKWSLSPWPSGYSSCFDTLIKEILLEAWVAPVSGRDWEIFMKNRRLQKWTQITGGQQTNHGQRNLEISSFALDPFSDLADYSPHTPLVSPILFSLKIDLIISSLLFSS